MTELGLDEDLVESDAVYHTAKHLLVDALDQIPEARFEADGDHLSSKYKSWQKVQTEQRLLNYTRMRKSFRISSVADPGSLKIEWSRDLGWKSNLQVNIRLHRSIDRDLYDNFLLACDEILVAPAADDVEMNVEQDVKLDSGYTYFYGNGFRGLEVFATASVISDETSFVVLTRGNHHVEIPSQGGRLSLGADEPASSILDSTLALDNPDDGVHSSRSDTEQLLTGGPDEPDENSDGFDEDWTAPLASAPSPRRVSPSMATSHLANRAGAAERSVSTEMPPPPLEEQNDTPMMNNSATHSPDNLSQTQEGVAYTLGERLMFVNLTTRRRWYELLGSNGREGVVGIAPGGSETEGGNDEEVDDEAGPSRKRRRARKQLY